MKKLLLALLFIPTIHGMELIERNNVSSADQSLRLYSNQKDFYVEDSAAAYRVEKHHMNPLLNEVMNRKALGQFKDAGYVRISKLEDGKYALAAHVRGEGGGPGGAAAGVAIGKFLTYSIGYGVLNLVVAPASAASGPLAPGVQIGANLVATPFIESASNVVGIGFGIIGAIITGPV